jgi:hypothetical protein
MRRIVFAVFHAAVVLVATAVAVWLTITGHTLQIGGLLLAMGAVLGAVMFGFRLAEGLEPDLLSIWAGPVWSIRPAAPGLRNNSETLRRAA